MLKVSQETGGDQNRMVDAEQVEKQVCYDYDDDFASEASSDESDAGPPPMIEIEKSAQFDTLKSAFANGQRQGAHAGDLASGVVEKLPAAERLGKETLASITSSFEGMKERRDQDSQQPKAERVPLTVADKERYCQFKQKFEHIGEEQAQQARRSSATEEIKGAGKDALSQAKEKFERASQLERPAAPQELVDIGLSAEEKKRIKETFSEVQDTAEQSDCKICGRVVYPMEKLQLEGNVYHKGCFRCCRCLKNLNVQTFSAHQGKLYCKVHMIQLFHPEAALAFDQDRGVQAAEDETAAFSDDEEGDYAVVRRPKALDPSVVKCSLKSTDDFGQINSVSSRRSVLEQLKDNKPERKLEMDDSLASAGSLKDKLSKFNEVEGQGPVVGQREEIVLPVGAKEMKNKWESAAAESVTFGADGRSDELDAIKAAVNVKERFKERQNDEEQAERRESRIEPDLDTSFSRESKARFLKGISSEESAQPSGRLEEDIQFSELGSVKKRFETAGDAKPPTERSDVVDVRCSDLGNIKAAFESSQQQKESERLQEVKKMQIESEFKRIKKEKRRLQEKERRESEELTKNEVKTVPYEDPTDVRQCAELSSIKERFEKGQAFDEVLEKKSGGIDADVEIKVAPKARQKFKKLVEEAPAVPQPCAYGVASKESKWSNKEALVVPEPVNRRPAETDEPDEGEPEDFEVKSLLNKFKSIGQADHSTAKGPKPQRVITPPPEGYRAEVESIGKERLPGIVVAEMTGKEVLTVKTDAKNLRDKFEKTAAQLSSGMEMSAEKRKELEDEFRRLKEEREQFKGQMVDQVDQPAPADQSQDKQDLALAAEHAQKMRARWEKIEKKEAKKAQKSAQAKRVIKKLANGLVEKCPVCTRAVYLAERFECDGVSYHRPCFRCSYCHMALRLDTFVQGSDGIYCKCHYKMLFNNPSKMFFDGRPVKLLVVQRA